MPFSSSSDLAAEAIMAGGSEAQKKAWLPKLASGEAIGTLALAEGPGKADVRKLRATFRNGALSAHQRCANERRPRSSGPPRSSPDWRR